MTLLIGQLAPDFTAQAVQNLPTHQHMFDLTLSALRGNYVLLFFYPLDFTFVCPTELHAFQEMLHEFDKRNCKVLGCSVDSAYTHAAWLRASRQEGGIHGVQYPLIADLNKTIAQQYGVLDTGKGIAFRGLFLIDQTGVVRHQLINDLPIGRSVTEALRTLDALIFFEANGEVCPANWQKGDRGFQATEQGVRQYLSTPCAS
jgi:peroxiredoxin (alkyl hydroperoxide reductase subunit C)